MSEVTDVELAIMDINTVGGRDAYRGLKRRYVLIEQRLRGTWELIEELERELAECEEKLSKLEPQNKYDGRWMHRPVTLADLARIGGGWCDERAGDGDDE